MYIAPAAQKTRARREKRSLHDNWGKIRELSNEDGSPLVQLSVALLFHPESSS
jgi:hypothetical protein